MLILKILGVVLLFIMAIDIILFIKEFKNAPVYEEDDF